MKMNSTRAAQAFSLVEVAISLGIAAFCLVAIFGLLPVGVNSNQASIEQTAAGNAAGAVILDLRAMPKGTDPAKYQSPLYKIPVPASPLTSPGTATVSTFFLREDGTATGNPGVDAKPADNPRYRVTITFTVPAANAVHYAVPTRVLVTWPALADRVAATAPTHYAGSLELDTALVRE